MAVEFWPAGHSVVEASALQHPAGIAGMHGRSPLLRLQSDERLIALVRRGNHHAFEALVARYQARLLAFCRHMLSSKEDAEDVLQEVFAAAFNAILADDRAINVRPWLYRIARNRSLNHLRRAQAVGVDSMDVHFSEHGQTTADKVHRREDFRMLIADVQDLPETQRTALLLREIDALSYEQIAEAMETTVPSVKSLLVRARVSLAEAAEARLLSCEEVRQELGEVAEGLSAHHRSRAAPPAHAASAARRSASSCARPTRRSRRCSPSGRCSCSRRPCSRTWARRAAAGGGGGRRLRCGAAAAGAAAAAGRPEHARHQDRRRARRRRDRHRRRRRGPARRAASRASGPPPRSPPRPPRRLPPRRRAAGRPPPRSRSPRAAVAGSPSSRQQAGRAPAKKAEGGRGRRRGREAGGRGHAGARRRRPSSTRATTVCSSPGRPARPPARTAPIAPTAQIPPAVVVSPTADAHHAAADPHARSRSRRRTPEPTPRPSRLRAPEPAARAPAAPVAAAAARLPRP